MVDVTYIYKIGEPLTLTEEGLSVKDLDIRDYFKNATFYIKDYVCYDSKKEWGVHMYFEREKVHSNPFYVSLNDLIKYYKAVV